MNHNEYVIKFNNKWQGEYEIIGTYLKSNLPILIKHNKCGRTYEKIASEALRYGCKECWMEKKAENLLDGGITKSQEQFLAQLEKKFGDEYKVIGRYNHNRRPVKLIHKVCGKEFLIRPASILYEGCGCTYCSQSNGAKAIEDYLINKEYSYLKEYSFDDLILINKLRFDFALFNKDKILCLIEYDGVQHYESNYYFGGDEKYESSKLRDSMKDRYCVDKGIELIRIPYYIKDIPTFLMQTMNEGAPHY